jgi:hypothetical protein
MDMIKMHARLTALCKSKVAFPGTVKFAHEGTSIPKFPGDSENFMLDSTFMEFIIQFCVHAI